MKISELIESASLLDYVKQYAEFNERGGEYWARSPLTSKDNDPSFSIRTEDNMFYDFSSGKGGNIINFIMAYHKCDFKTALNKLKEWLGVHDEIEFTKLQILSELSKFKPVRKKQKPVDRRVLDPEEAYRYDYLGFSFWDDEGLTADIVNKYGVGYDRQHDCITIPIHDQNGALVNLLCRTTNPNAKAIGLPKYIYKYKLNVLDFFYAWHRNANAIAEKNEVLIFEGCKSVMKVGEWGYTNAVAMLTSHMNDDQLRILIKHGRDCVFCLDHDINPAEDENITKLKRFCRVYIARDMTNTTGPKDSPCDAGREVFDNIYAERRRLI